MLLLGRTGTLLLAGLSVYGLLSAMLHQEWMVGVAAAATLGLTVITWRRLEGRSALWFSKLATRRLALVTAVATLVGAAFAIFIAAAGLHDNGATTAIGGLLVLSVPAIFYGYWWRAATKRVRRPPTA